uniref:Ovule protein n=1 Tax=Heterorhabditis bacteriophora TaxID=37862 RepID=A0A1I7WMK3_HETBA
MGKGLVVYNEEFPTCFLCRSRHYRILFLSYCTYNEDRIRIYGRSVKIKNSQTTSIVIINLLSEAFHTL